MAWGLSSWLGLTRCVQIVASLIASALHGFLFGWLSINRLGMANNVIVLQFMVCKKESPKVHESLCPSFNQSLTHGAS